jgi:hypothetical protein
MVVAVDADGVRLCKNSGHQQVCLLFISQMIYKYRAPKTEELFEKNLSHTTLSTTNPTETDPDSGWLLHTSYSILQDPCKLFYLLQDLS